MAQLAKALSAEEYGTSVYVGAQAELVVPDTGVSSVLVGYDAVWIQTDLSLGLGVGGDAVTDQDADDIYNVSLRLAFPVHRGVRSDFAPSSHPTLRWQPHSASRGSFAATTLPS
jgi:hypothetical protein